MASCSTRRRRSNVTRAKAKSWPSSRSGSGRRSTARHFTRPRRDRRQASTWSSSPATRTLYALTFVLGRTVDHGSSDDVELAAMADAGHGRAVEVARCERAATVRAGVVERVEDARGVRDRDPSPACVEGLEATDRDGAGLSYGHERGAGSLWRTGRWPADSHRPWPGRPFGELGASHASTWCWLVGGGSSPWVCSSGRPTRISCDAEQRGVSGWLDDRAGASRPAPRLSRAATPARARLRS